MSDEREQATGTTGGATGTASADGSATQPADGSAAALSAEELQKRLSEVETRLAEEVRVKQQLLSEKSNVERMRREAEEMAQRASNTPPMLATPADPFAEELNALTQAAMQLQAELTYSPDDVRLKAQAAQMASQIRSVQRQQQQHAEQVRYASMSRELLDVPEGIRQQVAARIMSGEATSVKAAREAVEGSSASAEVERLKAQLAEREAEVQKLRGIGPVADVSTSLRGTGAVTGARELPMAEYQRIMEAGGPQARNLLAEVDKGIVSIRH